MRNIKTHNLSLSSIISEEKLNVKVEEVCSLLERNERVVIDLQGKSLTANELLRVVLFIAEVTEYISFIHHSNYKGWGQCVVGDMVFRNGEDLVTF